ncbi:unnamed protein product [Acanthoscelides obtectus]|uniref:Uncharacterized protein n=1 Tax=Acanthoscelides obtectus TaxID=200917 RepID=A0A9P0P7S9_ACAOB|nr:unnamed protein product [Acanthoscelides obtectus]CAK1627679.1 Leucine-rich repeat and immunoglobulin-like domain-containing nogo receptor-interacting protein 1 [Acanthoscelides obtectus]
MEGKLICLVLVMAMNVQTPWSSTVDCRREVRCRISYTHRMKAADCFRKEFKEFPKCLPTDIEVLELTYNRIRTITRDDLSKFSYLKFLYLQDNLITELDDDVFSDMDELMTLDISINALRNIPATVFQLPSLKTLYLSQNRNINIIDALEGVKPINSPLTQVDISYTTPKDDVVEFPDFGPMPFLASLNISGNQYYSVKPKHFVGLCRLQKLVTDNVTIDFDTVCDCWTVNKWLMDMEVRFTPFHCSGSRNKCVDITIAEEDLKVFKQCNAVIEEIQRQHKMYQLSVGLIAFFIILLLSITLYFTVFRKHFKNRCCRNKSKKGNAKRESIPANSTLLTNIPKSVPNEYVL